MAYYGKLPSYFDFWLKAIEYNKTIDFCIISDCVPHSVEIPDNVRVLDLSFEKFQEKIQEKFDFKISLENYGRISQFRPALAYVFPEEITNYDFWGYIECDLIPGDIRTFITDEILDNYDKIFKLGHFQIFKNNLYMNQLFMQEKKNALSYKFAFSNDILFFEELLGMHNIANAVGCKTYQENVFADIRCDELMFRKSKYSYPDVIDTQCLFSYENGKLFCHWINEENKKMSQEVLYVHLQKRTMEKITKNLEKYLILPNYFAEYIELDAKTFEKIQNSVEPKADEYHSQMIEKIEKTRKGRYLKLAWWKLRALRFRIKFLHGGIDLNGK